MQLIPQTAKLRVNPLYSAPPDRALVLLGVFFAALEHDV